MGRILHLFPRIIICFLLVTIHFSIYGQTINQTIRGIVKDSESGIPLIGISVVLNTDPVVGTATNINGEFEMKNIPVGRYDVEFSMIGYETKIEQGIQLISGKETFINIGLTESLEQINEVVIKSQSRPNQPVNSLAVVSAKSFTIEQSSRYAASFDDPARMALSFAGVKGEDDVTNVLSIRGNNPRGILWRIEGVEVPSPNHFSDEGSTGGSVSMLSTVVLGESDFFSGAYPAEYGNATAGVFDLRLRNGNNEKTEATFQIGSLGIEAGLEGPLMKNNKSSYIVNYRYSTLALAEAVGFNTSNASSHYQDVNFKLNFPTKKAGTWSVFGLGGMSGLDVDVNESGNDMHYKTYDMGLLGIKNTLSLNDKHYLKSVLSFSAARETYLNKYIDYTGNWKENWRIESGKWIIRPSITLNSKFSNKSFLRTGIIYSFISFDSFEGSKRTYKTINRAWVSNGESSTIQTFGQWKYRFNGKLSMNTGVHFYYFNFNRQISIEPRLSLEYKINETHKLKFATGLHSLRESISFYMLKIQSINGGEELNRDVDFIKSFQVVMGYEANLKSLGILTLETYLQYLYNVPVSNRSRSIYSILNSMERYPIQVLNNNGKGINYGVDITLEKALSKGYYFLINLSLFESKYLANDGLWRNTRFNSNFITNLTCGKDFKVGSEKQNKISLNARVLWSGGYRIEETEFTEKIANFFRVDTRISYRKNKPRYSWEISVDLQNTTNRLNENLSLDIRPMGILPIVKFKIEI